MTSEFNVNQFREQRRGEEQKKSSIIDLALYSAAGLMVISLGSVFGYNKIKAYNASKPVMVMDETAPVEVSQGQYASIDDAMDSSPMMRMQKARVEKMVAPIIAREKAIREMSVKDYVRAKDLKGHDAQAAKYKRTKDILKQCGEGFQVVRSHYDDKNYPRLVKLKTSPGPGEVMAKSQAELRKLKTPADVMKYKMSGGIERHGVASMGMMSAFSDKPEKEVGSQRECQQVKQLAQTGALDIKL